MDFVTIGIALAALAVIALLVLAVYLHQYAAVDKEIHAEPWFSSRKNLAELPPLFKGAEIELSLVVPAYNEEERIGIMLDETREYLEKRSAKEPSFSFEVLVINDGCKDSTEPLVEQYARKHPGMGLRVVNYPDRKNRGKGGAVQYGALQSRGKRILMLDADAATDINDLDAMENRLESVEVNGMGIAVGSRSHLDEEEEKKASRTFLRNLVGDVFHGMVGFLCVRGIKDTQCGFKLFNRKSAQLVFANQHLKRWIFDVELLYIAQQSNHPLVEVPVNWHEVDGSKLSVASATIQMARDLLLIRLLFSTRTWKIVSVN